MLAKTARSIAPAMALLALGTIGTTARGQNIFNPYGNSGYADYREFARPEINNDPSLPGQARLQSQGFGDRPRANQYEAYTNSLDADGTRNGRPAAGPGVPYFQAYRQYDEQYKRVYKPNDSAANRKYVDLLKKRDEAYAKALDERDPVKRARLIRQIEQASIYSPSLPTTPRPAATARPASTARPATTPIPTPSTSTTRPPAPGAATRAARSLIPSPPAPEPAATFTPVRPKPSDPSSIAIPPPR